MQLVPPWCPVLAFLERDAIAAALLLSFLGTDAKSHFAVILTCKAMHALYHEYNETPLHSVYHTLRRMIPPTVPTRLSSLQIEFRHDNTIFTAQFSPYGQYAVTTSENNAFVWDANAIVWDAASARGLPIRKLQGHTDFVNDARFSPDGTRIVTASDDGTARIWMVDTGECVQTIGPFDEEVNTARFGPPRFGSHGELVLTAGDNASIYKASTGSLVFTLPVNDSYAWLADFSYNGSSVLVIDGKNIATLWSFGAVSPEPSPYTLVCNDEEVFMARFSTDGQRVLTASDDRLARVWDAANGRLVQTLTGHTEAVNSSSFSPNGALAVTTSDDGTFRVWMIATGMCIHAVQAAKPEAHAVCDASFSPDGKRLVVYGGRTRGFAQVWEVANARKLKTLEVDSDQVTSAAFSQNGERLLLIASGHPVARIWDLAY